MSTGRDDDALSWGDDDPTLDVGAARREPVAADAPEADPSPAETAPAPARETEAQTSSPLSSLALVLGGVYLAYVVGWIIGGLRLQLFAIGAIPTPFFWASVVLAVAAPIVWFTAVVLLTRDGKAWVRALWLVAGLVLLAPWPFLMIGPGA